MSLILQGSTSGSITLQEPAIAGTTVLDLPATSGTIALTSQTGKVLQVVQGTTTTPVDVTTTSYTDIGLSASITPSSASNKILILVNVSADGIKSSNLIFATFTNIVRNSTQVFQKSSGYSGATVSSTGFWYMPVNPSMNYLDSPSTTSAITYKVQAKLDDTGSLRTQINNGTSSIILMEIAA
jgi:hypothetical protein